MDKVMRIMRGRVASESGSVGVLVAFVIFLVMGMLTMTWNTAQISKTKMRLQNAADSAALAHAVWQARGMNVVQNINDEMYEGLSLAVKLRKIAEGLETAAQVLDGLANIPYVGWIFRGLAIISHTFAALAGGAGGWVAARVCKYFLKYLVIIYAKGAALFGIWNAQQLARQNEADPLAKIDTVGIYSIGFSYPLLDAFMLPLEASGKSEVNMPPWKVVESQILGAAKQPWKAVYQITGGKDAWEIKPYVSKRGSQEGLEGTDDKVTGDKVLPGPTMWIAFKLGRNIQTLPLDGFFNSGDSKRWTHKLPFFAVAAAQCMTGDVIPHSKKTEEGKTNQRPAGFGAGATAKLVPVSQVLYGWSNIAGTAVDAIIYH